MISTGSDVMFRVVNELYHSMMMSCECCNVKFRANKAIRISRVRRKQRYCHPGTFGRTFTVSREKGIHVNSCSAERNLEVNLVAFYCYCELRIATCGCRLRTISEIGQIDIRSDKSASFPRKPSVLASNRAKSPRPTCQVGCGT